MSSPWDNVEHVATVLEYSKTLVHLAVQGGAVTIGGNFVLNAAKYCFDHEGPLRGIIEHWHQILETLTDEQKAILETSSPGIVKQMHKNLAMLKQRLSFLALTLQKKTYFGIVLPWTESANCVKDVKMLFDEVDRDFTHTTRHVLRDNPVQLILTANDAVSHPVNVELSDLAVPGNNLTDTVGAGPAEEPRLAGAIRTPLPRVPEDVHLAYRSAVTIAAALIPAVLNRGRRGPPSPNTHPV